MRICYTRKAFFQPLIACACLLAGSAGLCAGNEDTRALQAQLPAIRDSLRYVDALNRLGGLFHARQLDTSFLYLNRARAIASRLNYAKGAADACRQLGSYYAFRDNSYLSYRFYLDALQRYKELGDSAGICITCMGVGIYYEYERQHTLAMQYIWEAMRIGKGLPDDSLYAQVLVNYYYVFNADPLRVDSARMALAAARSIAARHGDERLLIYAGLFQANELLEARQYTAAESLLDSLIRRANRKGYTYLVFYGFAQLADEASGRKHADTTRFRQQMLKAALTGGYRELALPVAMQLYAYYARHGNARAASSYSAAILDILEKQEQNKRQGELDYLSLYMQDQQLAQLQLQHEYQQELLNRKALESRNRYFVILFLAVLLLLTMLLLADVNKAHRRSRQNAARLGEKNREISEKNVLLSAHDDFKNKLISLIAHDFRTPLISIMEITTFLKDRSLSFEEATAFVRRLESNSRHTLHVFDNILRWIRSQLSGFTYSPQRCAPAAMIAEALRSLEDACNEKSLQVKVEVPAEMRLYADCEMLQFVHRNLLHNAVKFSPAGGIITVTAKVENGKATISVSDEGRGISPAMLPYLFRYSNNRQQKARDKGGAGLALIICRDFLDKMNGTIQAANNPGRGSTFSYTLPEAKPMEE